MPFNTFTLWNKFEVTREFSVGVGVHQPDPHLSPRRTTPSGCRASPASTCGLFYQVNEFVRAQVNIENLFDRRYIATADGNNNITPGAPRTIRAQVVARF